MKIKYILFTTLLLLLSVNIFSIDISAKNIDTDDNISLWIGDSRTVLIYQDLNMKSKNGTSYRSKAKIERFNSTSYLMLKYRDCYAARGIGYNFIKNSMPKIKSVAKKKECQNIILSPSVNDIYNTRLNSFYYYNNRKRVPASPEKLAKKYWKLFKKELIKKYKDDHFYILSINPVYRPLKYQGNTVTNEKIVRFNKTMKNLIAKSSFENVSYVDTYKNIFKKQGLIHKKSAYRYALKYRTTNVRYMRESSSYQLHYSDKVNKMLYKYVNDFIDKT